MEEYTAKVYRNRTEWYQDGYLHRVDGPAVERADGYKVWYQNGKLHRIDGPAIEHASGYKYWYQDGKRHRVDGPAIEHSNGYKAWYLNGTKLTEVELLKKTSPQTCEGKVVEIDGKKYKLTEV